MTSLKSVQGNNIYCGPAIISAITGVTTDQVEKMVQQLRHNDKPVVGMWDSELEAVFNKLGFKRIASNSIPKNSTLFNALCSITSGVWAIVVPGHYVCIEVDSDGKRWFIDNHTKKPISAAASARGMQRVRWIRKIAKVEDATKQ